MAGFVKFVAVAVLVGCSFCLVCAGNPYDMSGHFWPSRDTAKESERGARYFPPRLLYIPYEKKSCTLLFGGNNTFLPLGASFGTIAANVLMKKLDSTDRLVFPVWYCGFVYPHDSLYTRKLLGKIEMDSTLVVDDIPAIDKKYFVYNPPENEDVREEKSERPKTISAGFHNPTLVVSPESRRDIDDKMEKVGKGLCYGSIAAAMFMGSSADLLCGFK